jgi:hypothetical protein
MTLTIKTPHETIADEIVAERNRQITAEGFDRANDDSQDKGQLAKAAGFYALIAAPGTYRPIVESGEAPPQGWPWEGFWKPTSPRRNLIKAAALIIAEVERLDRKAEGGRNG